MNKKEDAYKCNAVPNKRVSVSFKKVFLTLFFQIRDMRVQMDEKKIYSLFIIFGGSKEKIQRLLFFLINRMVDLFEKEKQ